MVQILLLLGCVWVPVLCVYFGGWVEGTVRDMEKRERQRGKKRRKNTFPKRSETICHTENTFAAGEMYIC